MISSPVYFIKCTVPHHYVHRQLHIRNQIECFVATSTNYNHTAYYCKCPSVKINNYQFMFVSSHLASKILRTIQHHFPFIKIHIERQVGWL